MWREVNASPRPFAIVRVKHDAHAEALCVFMEHCYEHWLNAKFEFKVQGRTELLSHPNIIYISNLAVWSKHVRDFEAAVMPRVRGEDKTPVYPYSKTLHLFFPKTIKPETMFSDEVLCAIMRMSHLQSLYVSDASSGLLGAIGNFASDRPFDYLNVRRVIKSLEIGEMLVRLSDRCKRTWMGSNLMDWTRILCKMVQSGERYINLKDLRVGSVDYDGTEIPSSLCTLDLCVPDSGFHPDFVKQLHKFKWVRICGVLPTMTSNRRQFPLFDLAEGCSSLDIRLDAGELTNWNAVEEELAKAKFRPNSTLRIDIVNERLKDETVLNLARQPVRYFYFGAGLDQPRLSQKQVEIVAFEFTGTELSLNLQYHLSLKQHRVLARLRDTVHLLDTQDMHPANKQMFATWCKAYNVVVAMDSPQSNPLTVLAHKCGDHSVRRELLSWILL